MSIKLTQAMQSIRKSPWIDEIIKHGAIPYFVGGCVRDLFLDKNPKDIDIVTEKISKTKLISILEKFGKVDLVGECFAVIKFKPFDIELDEPLDISTPRKETKNGVGHKGFDVVSDESVTLIDDLKRRDFTINSMCIDIQDGIHIDPLNGLSDLNAGLIRAANAKTFIDDALRIARAVQFASRFGFRIESNTLCMMRNNIKLLKEISGERILDEFSKIIKKQGSVSTAFKILVEIGFFETFGLTTNKHMPITDSDFKTLGDLMHLLLFFEKDKHTILASTFKADNNTKKQVKALDTMHKLMDKSGVPDEFIAADMVKITPDAFKLGCVFQCVKDILVPMETGQLPAKITDLEIGGDELKEMGLEGKEIGDALQLLFEMVLLGELPNDNSVLLSVVKQLQKKQANQLKKGIDQLIVQEKNNGIWFK